MSLPSLVLENQFGEVSNNFIKGGSSQLSCSFTVAAADAGGAGITGLVTSGGIKSVFMHTSQTPAAGNPNPAVGYILVELASNYLGFSKFNYDLVAPKSGSDVNISSGLSANGVYQITAVGTSTAANWQAIGLPVGIVPAVGVVFTASTASAGTGTGTVQAIAAAGSTLGHIELVGNPSTMANPSDNSGASLYLVALGATNSSTTTLVAHAPADGTQISLSLNMIPLAQPLI